MNLFPFFFAFFFTFP
ncbi:hypothetical protein [Buttiauxella brennerae]|nr:hypothetical protein [Buttiauxella brennerae]